MLYRPFIDQMQFEPVGLLCRYISVECSLYVKRKDSVISSQQRSNGGASLSTNDMQLIKDHSKTSTKSKLRAPRLTYKMIVRLSHCSMPITFQFTFTKCHRA